MPQSSPIHGTAAGSTAVRALADVVATEGLVVAAYLFGSAVQGTTGPLSDVDVAILVAAGADDETVCGRVMDGLARRLESNRIDVLSLGRAPSPVRYRVVRDGVLVVGRDKAALDRFVAESVLAYLDFQPIRDRGFLRMRKSIVGTP